jgi:hypothetical protein
MPGLSGRGHRPCHSAALSLGQPGAKAPGQRPTLPWRALLARQVGRWPALFLDLTIYRAPSRAGGGNAMRFLSPPGVAFSRMPGLSGRGHRPCHSAALSLGQPGAKAPGQRSPCPRRALLARQVGRWPALFLDLTIYRAPSRAGGETQCVS